MAQKPKRRWFDRQHLADLAVHIPIAVTTFVAVYLAAGAPLGTWPQTIGFGLIGSLVAIPISYLIPFPYLGRH